jgi:hypothetical protein
MDKSWIPKVHHGLVGIFFFLIFCFMQGYIKMTIFLETSKWESQNF